MYNSDVSFSIPFAAAGKRRQHRINLILGFILIPLILWVSAEIVMSDFGGGYFAKNDNFTADINQRSQSATSGGQYPTGSPSICFSAKGMILLPAPVYESCFGSSAVDSKGGGAVGDTTTYLSADMVDIPPELIWMIYPEYSDDNMHDISPVKIVLKILVDQSGQASEVVITEEPSVNHGFTEAVLESARTSVFTPAMKDNHPVKCWISFPLEVSLDA